MAGQIWPVSGTFSTPRWQPTRSPWPPGRDAPRQQRFRPAGSARYHRHHGAGPVLPGCPAEGAFCRGSPTHCHRLSHKAPPGAADLIRLCLPILAGKTNEQSERGAKALLQKNALGRIRLARKCGGQSNARCKAVKERRPEVVAKPSAQFSREHTQGPDEDRLWPRWQPANIATLRRKSKQ